jgi:hypothetical protein
MCQSPITRTAAERACVAFEYSVRSCSRSRSTELTGEACSVNREIGQVVAKRQSLCPLPGTRGRDLIPAGIPRVLRALVVSLIRA